MNNISREIGNLFREGKTQEADSARAKTSALKESIKLLDAEFADIEKKVSELLIQLPNIPHDSVPAGKGAEDNELVKSSGEMPQLPENALAHWDLAQKYNLIDFELGVKITGAGFPVYRGKGAQLQRALINFFWMKTAKPDMKRFSHRWQ